MYEGEEIQSHHQHLTRCMRVLWNKQRIITSNYVAIMLQLMCGEHGIILSVRSN